MSAGPRVFDGGILAAPITGVGRSFCDTLAAYAERTSRPPVLLAPRDARFDPPSGVNVVRLPGAGRGPGWRRLVSRAASELEASLLHSPVAALPRRCPCPAVATVHDLPWLAPVALAEPGVGLRHRLALRRAVRVATRLVVPSAATAKDLLRAWGKDLAGRVRVVPHGTPAPEAPAAYEDLRGPFLFLGDDRPRKNLERLRHAWRLARTVAPDLPGLRVVGPHHGYVTETEKLELLRSARALVHVSLFEGFGLPVLEAFAHGVPVVCSTAGGLAEVAADAAWRVDPFDVEDIARGLVRVHRDEDLRRSLRRRGLARAAALRPEHSAAGWEEIHEEIAR